MTLMLPVMAMRELTVGGSYVGKPRRSLRELVALAASNGNAGRRLPVEPPLPMAAGERCADAAA